MKRQSIKDKIHEHLGAKNLGKKKQSMKDRTHELKGMEKAVHHYATHAIKADNKKTIKKK